MRIAVVGSGYVGLVSAACLAEIGHQVISVDTNVEKIAALQRGEVPIHEQLLPQLLERHRGKGLTFSSSVSAAVRGIGSRVHHGRHASGRSGEPDFRMSSRLPPRSPLLSPGPS